MTLAEYIRIKRGQGWRVECDGVCLYLAAPELRDGMEHRIYVERGRVISTIYDEAGTRRYEDDLTEVIHAA